MYVTIWDRDMNTYHESLVFKWILRGLLAASIFMASHGAAIAGGFHVFPDSIRFLQSNKALSSVEKIDPGYPVEMEFRFEHYTYAGKPYAYAIFEIFEKEEFGAGPSIPTGSCIYRLPVPDHPGSGFGKITFVLPRPKRLYEIRCHDIAYVAFQPLVSALTGGYLDSNELRTIELFYRDPSNYPGTTSLTKIATGPPLDVLPPPAYLTVYLRDFKKTVNEIAKGIPPTFRWFVGPETSKLARNIEFSYRLLGSEDWTIYSSSTKATYDFMRPGNYLFQVKARYSINGDLLESGIAQEGLTVDKEIFRITKAETLRSQPGAGASKEFLDSKHYNKSRALLIGVPVYQEFGSFPPISFVIEDIRIMREVLTHKYDFEIEPLTDDPIIPTKSDIIAKLEAFKKSINEGDRAIAYFSCHGAEEGDEGYIVPYDARANDKGNTCLRLEYLKDWVNQLMDERKAKHVLIILDSCHSGLGLLSKSARTSSIMQLDLYPGAHMLTAGLTHQEAYADLDKKKSLFTYFLVEGLNGRADYNGDQLITMLELAGYVQNGVAGRVSKLTGKMLQTPVMGKIKGQGEMLFILR